MNLGLEQGVTDHQLLVTVIVIGTLATFVFLICIMRLEDDIHELKSWMDYMRGKKR